MYKSGLISIAGILLLLLLTIMIFLLFYPWIESIDSDLKISLEEDTADVSIVSFKNDSLELTTNTNVEITSLAIENETIFCERVGLSITKPRDSINVSSCSLERGNIYTISILLFNSITQKTMVYR